MAVEPGNEKSYCDRLLRELRILFRLSPHMEPEEIDDLVRYHRWCCPSCGVETAWRPPVLPLSRDLPEG